MYNNNSTYQNNLNKVLSNLTNKSSVTGFGTYTAGVGSNTVYGLYNCRGDLDSQMCHECVQEASKLIITECPSKMEAIIWYDECTLRYANRSIFSHFEDSPVIIPEYGEVYSDPNLAEVLRDTMNGLIKKAAYDNSTKGYAEGQGILTKYADTLYCLVQCTPDILGSQCEKCLRSALTTMPKDLTVYMIFSPSCNVFYGIGHFTGTTNNDSSTAVPPTPYIKGSFPSPKEKKLSIITTVVLPIIAAAIVLVLIFFCTCWFYKHKKNAKELPTIHVIQEVPKDLNELSGPDSVQFNFSEINAATNSFAADNKLGEGGFGSVYKGRLGNGQEIAVKRLSIHSRQGFREFKTEVLIIIKLQHKNLVRLLGFCIEKEEYILVYELLPNLSLDKFLFDTKKRANLDWRTRYNIIIGIARGLLYLHEDSRLTIVHRDLKSSNILLDEAMNPKIADFGMARLFGAEQIYASTKLIVGTYGYMAPEYAMHGHFSVKSDVYSFGMIILEILSGQSCTLNNPSEYENSLLYHTWMCWNVKQPLSVVDMSLSGNFSVEEVIKCIHIGLLCIQDEASRRPTMPWIVNQLNNNSTTDLPEPAPPLMRHPVDVQVISSETIPSETTHTNVGSSSQDLGKFSGTREISELLPR